MNPCLASAAAVMPATPAHPGCMRLVQAPSSKNSMLPAPVLSAIPWAMVSSSALAPNSRPAARAHPNAPTSPVG